MQLVAGDRELLLLARRQPLLRCCMLRYQPEIGPALDAPLVRYLTLPVVPVQLGFDPRLQLLHADDATAALAAAVANPVRGAVNVGPEGAISLSHALRLLGRRSIVASAVSMSSTSTTTTGPADGLSSRFIMPPPMYPGSVGPASPEGPVVTRV